jgi:hypothetical protein
MKKEHLVEMGKIFLISMVAVVTYDKVVKPMILQKFIKGY